MNADKLSAALAAVPLRTRLVVGAAAAIAVILSIAWTVASHGARVNLFASSLRSEQLAEVQDELASWNVPFTPVADNVVVDPRSRNDVLLRLSLAGVPHAHVATTSETLANVGVLTPQAVVDAQTRAGLAGDIEVGLRSVEGVDDARVIIAPAKTAEFADESGRDASASVRLRLHPGATLGRDAVAGVRQFVAASVAGLEASRVTILDDRGMALNNGSGGGDADALQRSLQSALDAALGTGASIVRVHEEYDRAATERRVTDRRPLREIPIVRNDVSETYDGAGKRYEKREQHDDRGSDTSEMVSRTEPGQVLRRSTAVFVDASRSTDLETVRQLAAATVGFSAKRGDTLVVQTVDFHREPRAKRDGWFLLYGAIVPLLPSLVLAGAAFVVARLGYPLVASLGRSLVERTAIERATRSVSGYAPAHVRNALECEPPHAAAAIISALPAATAAAVLELYPEHERQAIVSRMQRSLSPLVPSAAEILGRHA